MKATRTVLDRLLAKLTPGPNGCLVWSAKSVVNGGYGIIKDGDRHKVAHRVAWEQTFGPIPDGLHVCHRCDNPPCCNPLHLFLGTPGDNARDRERKGRGSIPRHNAAKTHCPKNHAYDAENTYVVPSTGERRCRACGREESSRRRARLRAIQT